MSETSRQEQRRTEIERLRWIVHQLRQHCAWTAQLDHSQLTQYMIEEAYEAVETIETGQLDKNNLGAELSDVLFQVVLHSQLAQEQQRFTFDDVAAILSNKMIRRNPHVFTPDGELLPAEQLDQLTVAQIATQWETIKRTEPATAEPQPAPSSAKKSRSKPGPALATAQLQVARAQRAGQHPAPDTQQRAATLEFQDEEKLAEHLYAVVVAAEKAGLDAEKALRKRNRV